MFAHRVVIVNATGLHVRSATLFMNTAARFRSSIRVRKGSQSVDGKSAIALMLLEALRGTELTIEAEGDDEVAAVNALVSLVEHHFEESA